MSRIITETPSPAMYSMRAWPYGCSLSAGFAERRKPRSVTMLDDASERLFRPSAMTETLPATRPARSLAQHRSRLHTMPTAPARLPYAVRTRGSDTSSLFRTNNRMSKPVKKDPFLKLKYSIYYILSARKVQDDWTAAGGSCIIKFMRTPGRFAGKGVVLWRTGRSSRF